MNITQECAKGHDLTAENAWLYKNGGYRECRQCAVNTKRIKKKPKYELSKPVNYWAS